jgi:hypothetical protein
MRKSIEEPNYIKKRRDAERNQRESQHHEDNMHVIGALDRIRDELVSTEKQDQADDDKRASREILTIILLIFTVIFTGGADIIFYCTMRDARSATAKAHQDNIAALSKADEANKTSRESFTAVQRAYVIVTDLPVSTTSYDSGISWEYVPAVVNVGNTQSANLGIIEIGPGNMRSLIGAKFMFPLTAEQNRKFCISTQLGVPADPDVIFHSPDLRRDTNTRIFNFIIGPKQPVKYPAVESRVGSSIGANTVGGMIEMPNVDWPYFFGEIVYNDVFMGTPNHVTKYCFQTTGVQAGDATHTGGFLIGYCRHWNCADEECEADKKRYEDEAAKVANKCK